MPTQKKRPSFAVEPDLLADIEAYNIQKEINNLSAAIRELLVKGLEASKGKAAPSQDAPSEDGLSQAAVRLARVYDGLDVFGQKALNQTAERERERLDAQQGPVHRPLAARGGKTPLDLSALEPISLDEAKRKDTKL